METKRACNGQPCLDGHAIPQLQVLDKTVLTRKVLKYLENSTVCQVG